LNGDRAPQLKASVRLLSLIKTMTRIPNCCVIIAFITLLGASLSGVAFPVTYRLVSIQQESKWVWCLGNGEEFSVLLPELPSLAVKSRPNKAIDARYEGRIYGAYDEGIVYLVISENNPKHAEKLDNFIREFKETLPRHRTKGSSQLTFDRELQLDNFPGKRYRVKFYNGIEGIVDFYTTNKHVYIVEVAGDDGSNPTVQQFLQSFSLDENVLRKETARATPPPTIVAQTATNASQSVDQIFLIKDVTRPAFAVSRPEPFYTEEARRNQVVGTVVLTTVFSSSGKVTNMEVVKGLKYGLTERAVDAARKLKFIPALKDGKLVSQRIQLEYNFNLY
jgi:TonB family protein